METSGSAHGDTLLRREKPAIWPPRRCLSVGPMALFSFIAGVLVGGAAVRVVLPLCRSAAALTWRRGAYVRAGALIASFAVAAGILYLAIGSRHGLERPEARAAGSPSAASKSGKGAETTTARSMAPKSLGSKRAWLAKAARRRTGPCWHRRTTSSGARRMPNVRARRLALPPRGLRFGRWGPGP